MMLTPEDQAWIDQQMTLAGRPPAPKLEDYVPRDHDFTRAEYIMRKGMWRHAHAEWAANDLRHSTIYVLLPSVPQKPQWRAANPWQSAGVVIVFGFCALLTFMAIQANGVLPGLLLGLAFTGPIMSGIFAKVSKS